MKTSPTIGTPILFMPSTMKTKKNPKSFKLNHRPAISPKSLAPIAVPVNTYQLLPISPMWSNPPPSLIHSIAPTANAPTAISPPSQNVSSYSMYKPFITPRVTTTLIPLNVCPIEYSQAAKATSTPLVNILQPRQEQNIYEHKSNDSTITHLIGDWIIRESSKPFPRKENNRSTVIVEQSTDQPTRSSSPKNIHQWKVDDVCAFFERVLGKSTYASIIEEHLIDGTALLLLEDEHLASIFHMQLGPRLKLLDRIQRLKKGDFSAM